MKNKRLFNKATNWTINFVKERDRFGKNISLNFEGKGVFKTTIGGFTTILLSILMIVYSAILLKQMINRENSVINTSTKIRNLIYDPTKYNLEDYSFVFVIYSEGAYASTVYDSNYFDLQIQQASEYK